jgi:hypothetical protein
MILSLTSAGGPNLGCIVRVSLIKIEHFSKGPARRFKYGLVASDVSCGSSTAAPSIELRGKKTPNNGLETVGWRGR